MEETTATTETQPFLGEDWFDPLETAVRGRIRALRFPAERLSTLELPPGRAFSRASTLIIWPTACRC